MLYPKERSISSLLIATLATAGWISAASTDSIERYPNPAPSPIDEPPVVGTPIEESSPNPFADREPRAAGALFQQDSDSDRDRA